MKQLRVALLKREIHSGGGLEKYFRKIYSVLSDRGHHVSVLSMEESAAIPVVRVCRKVPLTLFNMLWFDFNARKWLKKNPQDIILGLDRHFLPLTHYRAGNGCHAAFLERRKKESSWLKSLLLSCNPLHYATILSEKKTFESITTKIICNSQLVRQEILRFYPKACSENIVVLHNGVEWKELEKPFFERKILPIPHLLFVGHEWQRKGLDRILLSLALVKKPFFLTAIGKERYPEKFSLLAKKLGLEKHVKLISRAQNPIPFYQQSSIMLIPSRYDPFANVTLEALSMGLFVITTEANGASEILTAETGIVLKEAASSEDFACAIQSVLGKTHPVQIRESVREYDFSKKMDHFIKYLETSHAE